MGNLVECCILLCRELEDVVDTFLEDDAVAIKQAQVLFSEVTFVNQNYSFICTPIKQLENSNLPVRDSLQILAAVL